MSLLDEKRKGVCLSARDGKSKRKAVILKVFHLADVLEMEAEVVLRIDDNMFLLLCSDEKEVC